MANEHVFKLTTPVQHGDNELTELVLREPTTAEYVEIGDPYVFNTDGTIVFNQKIITKYIAKCAGIPPSVVNKLGLYDRQQVGYMVVGFFAPTA